MMRDYWLVLGLFLLGCGGQQAVVQETAAVVAETAVIEETAVVAATAQVSQMMAESDMGMLGGGGEVGRQVEKRPLMAAPSGDAETQAIDLAASYPPVADYLAGFDWVGSAHIHDESAQTWGVDFSTSDGEEWLGWADVDLANGTVTDYFVPRDLEPDQFQAGQAKIMTFLQADAEMNALLGDFSLWESSVWYNRWEANWEAWFGRGLDEWVVVLSLDPDSGDIWIDSISDPSVLEAEEQHQWDRNQAVELAFAAEGLWEVLDGVENWRTLASPHGDGIWTVDFVAPGQLYFSAVVDIVNWEIVEAGG